MIDFKVGPASGNLFSYANKEAAAMQQPFEEAEEEQMRRITKNPFLQTTMKYNKLEDKEPRLPLSNTSSWIDDITYDPNTLTATISMNGNPYDFSPAYGNAFTPEEIESMLTSPSIGAWLWDNNKFISKGRK